MISVEGAEPTIERKKGKREPTTSREPTGRPPGPGTFRNPPEGGYQQHVVPNGGVPFGYPQPIEFKASEAHLRSKLEDLLGKPILFLNSAHDDYKSRVDLKDSNIFIRYVIELIAKEAAYFEIRKAERDGILSGNRDEIVNSALQKEEFIRFLALKRLGIK